MILISIWVLVIVPSMTYSLFVDTETSVGNTFSASTLETHIYTESPGAIVRNLIPDKEVSFSLELVNTGGLDTQNSISIHIISNEKFASLIKTEVRLSGEKIIYQGFLDKLDIPKYLIQQPNQRDKLTFHFFISENNYNSTPEEFVKFKIQNHAWQTNMPYGSGFYHNQEINVALINPLEKLHEAESLLVAPSSLESPESNPKEGLTVVNILENNEDEF